MRIRDYGIIIGNGKTGKLNKITDVPGVKVGHYTLSDEMHNTGITVIMPHSGNPYLNKCVAASYVINGYGKTMGLVQIEELGYIETPIFLTNTLNAGKVHDGVVSYMIDICMRDGVNLTSINPVVGEVNDYPLNNIQDRKLGENEVLAAINNASINFEEGDVGAGKGSICCRVKGGIGSASRLTLIDGKYYTIGVLVQTNFGGELVIDDVKVSSMIKSKTEKMDASKGSIMIVVATDLPVSELQLKRIIKRATVGLSRTGSTIGSDSGDVVIGFSTANQIVKNEDSSFRMVKVVDDSKLNYAFKQVADATEEAILNSLACAHTVKGYNGTTRYSLKDVYLDDYFKSKNYEAFIPNFPVLNQFPDYPTGCESVALFTLLKYYGVNVTMEEITQTLRKGKIPYEEDGILCGGNPKREFVGDPTDVYSYGVYDKPIAKVANKFKKGIKNITGASLKEVLDLVKKGYPVQVWSSIKLLDPYISKSWVDVETGDVVNWRAPLHSMVLIGYSDKVVVVSDPDTGSIHEFDMVKFENCYNFFGKRALYYEEEK